MKLKQQDHFRVLKLTRGAGSTDVENAFDRLAWRYHPDNYLRGTPQVQELAEGIFNRLRDAYLVLRSPFRREGYLAQLGDGESKEGAQDEQLEAQRHFDSGMDHLGEGRYEKASWHLRRALSLNERSALFSAHLGWAVHKTGPTDHVTNKEARRHLERAIQLDPQLDIPHVYFGYLFLVEEEVERAQESFQKAFNLNPDNQEAAAQLKEIADHAR